MKSKHNNGFALIEVILLIGIICIVGFMIFVFISDYSRDATVASRNISTAADMFEIKRRIVFYNGITGDYILSVEGACSIEVDGTDNQLELTCKTGENEFKKHYLGLSDNVTYFAEHLDPSDVDVNHYRVIFKPSVIIPDIDIR